MDLPSVFLSCTATVRAPLLRDPAGSTGQKEGLLPPESCKRGWYLFSSHSHLISLQKSETCSDFVSVSLLMLFSLHTTLTYVSFVQSLHTFQEYGSGATAPGPAFPRCRVCSSCCCSMDVVRIPLFMQLVVPQWNLTSSRQGLLSFT